MGGTIDFNKAFDSVQREAFWRSLRNHSVSEQYIRILKKLHNDQRATVLTDLESDLGSLAEQKKAFSNQQWGKTLKLGERKGLGHQTE